ncbi:TPD1 protein homolog 1-like [Typha angustifolia]|uniref:TPD1 protein homolog 1-like n=1 Tax=Typha angustifolia TaxID=59011 RepID=UPI003C2E1D24
MHAESEGPLFHYEVHRTVRMRKLLKTAGGEATEGARSTARTGLEACSKADVVVYQGATAPLPNGIPTYTVEILNVCVSGCAVSDIHVACGWFSSARLINPRIFRRVQFDDCLVNDGAALGPGESLSFQYANTYRYPLDVTSVSCY